MNTLLYSYNNNSTCFYRVHPKTLNPKTPCLVPSVLSASIARSDACGQTGLSEHTALAKGLGFLEFRVSRV